VPSGGGLAYPDRAMQRFLGALALGGLAFIGFEPQSDCHANHCHGEAIKICGGGWKRYKEPREHVGPAGGAATGAEACTAAVAELEKKLAAEALEKCTALHPCTTCPGECNGCAQDNPVGSIPNADDTRTSSRQRSDGKFECVVKAEAAFRCACSACIKKKT
jgi:hypothetical protein